MAIEVFNRVEKKYPLSGEMKNAVIDALLPYMTIDPYNIDGEAYRLCNVYFDTPDARFIRHSLSHPLYKEKLRLRSYGVPADDDLVYLELKKKFRGRVNKRRTTLFYREARAFLETGRLPAPKPHMNAQVLRELNAFLSDHPSAIPMVNISYRRLAFLGKNDPSLRISFDQDILARRDNVAPHEGIYGDALLSDNRFLMEIKATGSYPLWLVNILSSLNICRASFSKYGTAYLRWMEQALHHPETDETAILTGGLL